MLKHGISVVSIEYRFINEATADKVVPPVKGPLSDAARALQFVRSKAAEWNIDKWRLAFVAIFREHLLKHLPEWACHCLGAR